MKKQKQIQLNIAGPKDFDFGMNRGRSISIHTTDNKVKSGVLQGLIDNCLVFLRFTSKSGIPGLSEIDFSEIKYIKF